MNRMFTKKKAKRAAPAPELKFELDLTTALPSSKDFRTSLLMPGLSSRFSMLREQDDPTSMLGKASDDSVLEPKRQSRLYDFGFKPSGLADIAEVSSIRSSVRPPFTNEQRTDSFASDNDYATDGDAEGGSVMSRARQGEGNVLFGGRQKITRIGGDGSKGRTLYDDDVAKSTFQKWRAEERQREREAIESGRGKKFSFEEERKSPAKSGSYAPSVAGSLKRQTSSSTVTSGVDSRSSTAATSINSQGPPSASHSPATGFSGFNFGPLVSASSSTPTLTEHEEPPQSQPSAPTCAPPSIPVASINGSMAKRRLYDNGLNRELQDQQTSAMSRLQSFSNRPGMNGTNGRSASDTFAQRNGSHSGAKPIQNGYAGPQAMQSHPTTALQRKPTLTGLPGRNVKIDPSNLDQISPLPRSPLPPVSPNTASQPAREEILASSVNSHDRGKATAMGVFNKPQQQFNEQQYLERQATMRMGRETPTPRPHHIETVTESLNNVSTIREEPSPLSTPTFPPGQISEQYPRLDLSPVSPIEPAPLASKPLPSQPHWDMSRSVSNGPFNRARSESTTEQTDSSTAPTPFSAFQRAANQLKGAPPAMSIPVPRKLSPALERKDTPQMSSNKRFNFVDDSDSDYEDESSARPVQPLSNGAVPVHIPTVDNTPPLIPPPRHEHPAFRSSPQPLRENLHVDVRKSLVGQGVSEGNQSVSGEVVDSPTLPATAGNGLSGMIRHLRDNSATSTYSTMTMAAPIPTPSYGPTLQTRNLNSTQNGPTSAGATTTTHSSYSHSNPWDLEEFNGAIKNLEPRDSVSLRGDDAGKVVSAEVAPLKSATALREDVSREPSWQQELSKKNHTRSGSTETQHEREALASELAQRQKAIQEKMRERAEKDMRSASPGPSKPIAPFIGMLRQKPSLDNFRSREQSRTRDESQPRGQSRPRADTGNGGVDKAAKFLGLSGSSAALATQNRPSPDIERSQLPRSVPLPMQRPSRGLQQQDSYGQPSNSASASRPSTGRGSSEEKVRSRSNSNAPIPVSGRSRSNSELSGGRSRSRYRDDSASSAAEATIHEDVPPQGPAPDYAIPELPEDLSRSNTRMEYRPVDAANFEQKGLWPPQQNAVVHPFGAPSPRPSPGFAPPFAANNGPLSNMPHRPSPSPSSGMSPGLGQMSPGIFNSGRGTPISQFGHLTPPLSSSSTPVSSAFPAAASAPNLLATAGAKGNRSRKMSIRKSDIGDPTLISTTSVVDTVALPAGASLRNGMENMAPIVPPINPRRKRFGFGRADTEPPEPAFARPIYGLGSLSSDEIPTRRGTRHRLKKSSSDGAKIGLYIRSQQESKFANSTQSTPALAQLQTSPPRMQNGMF